MKKIVELATELKDNPSKHANHVPQLLHAIETCSDEATLHLVLPSLHAFFNTAFDAAHLRRNNKKAKPGSGKEVFRSWLSRQLAAYVKALNSLLRKEVSASVQLDAFSGIMEAVRGPAPGHFGTAVFSQLLDSIMHSRHVAQQLMSTFLTAYLPLADVRLYTLKWIKAACDGRMERRVDVSTGSGASDGEGGESDGNSGKGWQLSEHDQARNIYDVLVQLVPREEEEEELKSWTGVAEAGAATAAVSTNEGSKARRKKRKRAAENGQDGTVDDGAVRVQWANTKVQKKVFSTAWLSFLRTSLPDDIYRKVLLRCHSDIIPHINHPVLLSDFLTGAVKKGGLTALLALNSVFILVTQHGLEYPQFYHQLYILLTPAVFKAKYKARFFTLLDVFLASGKVPAYSAAAFVKRMARLALRAPPAGAMIAIAFIHNILRNHPSCNVLLHNPRAASKNTEHGSGVQIQNSNSNFEGGSSTSGDESEDDGGGQEGVGNGDVEMGGRETAIRGVSEMTETASPPGVDVFIEDDDNPETCRAIESSLWELAALQNHYSPQVATFAQILDKDLTERTKNADVDIGALLNESYVSLIKADLGKRLKKVATAFYPRPPTRLFDVNAVDDFKGWDVAEP